MPGLSRSSSVWLPVVVILIAMLSIQSGASLAKSLFPLVGAPGVTALRIALGTAILVVIFKPWRLRFKKEQRLPLLFYGLSLGAMNYMFYLLACGSCCRWARASQRSISRARRWLWGRVPAGLSIY